MLKYMDMVEQLRQIANVEGLREVKAWRTRFKSLYRSTSQIVFKGKDANKKKDAVKEYMEVGLELKGRCEVIVKNASKVPDAQFTINLILESLKQYCEYATKFCNLIERRLIKAEEIPAEEKVYSIFEPHTEWLC